MTIIKICGITNVEDARSAARLGADLLGFVFAPSPRRIAPEKAAEISADLTSTVKKVGVFVDEEQNVVEEIAALCNLDFVQLHGCETRGYVSALGVPWIKAFSAKSEEVLDEIVSYKNDLFLLDAYHPEKRGGTGTRIDVSLAAKAAKLGKMILAGGLDPDNVLSAVKEIRPYGVDASSGMEKSPGKKDIEKMEKFISEVRKCDRG